MSGGARETDSLRRAVVCALAGGAVLTLSDGLVKSLTADLPSGQILAIRGLFVYLMIALLAVREGGIATMWRVKSWRGQLLRGFCYIGSSFSFVVALQSLPLALVTAINFAGPLIVTALAPMLLNESIGWRRWVAVLTGFVGVLLIIRPGAQGFEWVLLLPLVSAFLGALRDIVTRRLAPTETTVAVLFVTTTAVTGTGWMTWFKGNWSPIDAHHLMFLAGSGLLVGLAHYLVIESFRFGEAAVVSPFKYVTLLWATLLGFLMFGDVPTGATVAGATIIVASGLYIIHRERVARR